MKITAFRGMHPSFQFLFSLFIIMVSFLAISILSTLIAIPVFGLTSIIALFTTPDYNNPEAIMMLKYFQTTQSIGIFLMPPFIIAYLFEGSIKKYLQLNPNFKTGLILLAFLLILTVNPSINFLGEINKQMHFPEWLAGLEAKMLQMEENANLMIQKFMDVKTTGGLLFNILMIAVIPAIGEEFLFRGVMQRIFSDMTRNQHWGIWIAAIFFSALHFQFYGFIPRMLLGVLFGYMLVWSGSIWIPIAAHFFNNLMGVLGLYAINNGLIDPKFENIGSETGQLPLTIVSIVLTGLILYVFYRQKKTITIEK